MRTRYAPTRPRVAAAIAAVAWGLAVLALCLLGGVRPGLDENLWFLVVDVTVACVYGTVAAVILSRRAHPVAWIVAVAAVGGGLAALGYAGEAWWTEHGQGPLPWALDAVNSTAWVPGTMAIFLVVPWLVRDHPLGGAAWGLGAGVLVVVGMTIGSALGLDLVVGIGLIASVPLGMVAAGAVELRRRRGPVEERNGLGWLALGTLLMACSFVPLLLPLGLPVWVTPVLHLASQAFFPAAVLVAALRGRMWGLDLAISRTVLVALLTLVLLLVYLVAVGLLGLVLPGEGLAGVVAAGAVAVAVQPVRLWLEARVRHLVHGAGADPGHVVRRLGTQLGKAGTADALLVDVAEDLAQAMRLDSVVVRPEAGEQPLAAWGTPRAEPHVVPLRHRGVEIGRLEVTTPPGEALGVRGQRTLVELSPVVAAAVAVSDAARDVAELRSRLARARVAERRLIRREIHDGLGPSLAGVRLGLQGVRNLVATDPGSAAELLDALDTELGARIVAVRELSHQLLPPVLIELGLEAALTELAGRQSTPDLVVHLDLADTTGLDTDVATAAYGIAGEAVANVRRHAGATGCWVSTTLSAQRLELTVRDDGNGLADEARSGVGTQTMAERADEQGGAVEIVSRPGEGTVVRASLPCAQDREAAGSTHG